MALVAASCGGDDDEATPDDSASPATTSADGSATTAAAPSPWGAPGTTSGDPGTAPPSGTAGCPAIDDSIDADEGSGAGRFLSDVQCALDAPLVAEGEPVVIGFQNHEGDPAGSFPESTNGALAAVEFINNELGGWGADIQNGVPGRPIELAVCKMAVSPDDSQRCANELLAEDPFLIVSSLNFFGNQLPIYEAAGIPGIVLTPITIGDFTSTGSYAIGGGGGCLGVHTGLVEFTVTDLEARRISVPWSDTPPGVVCYYDLEAKPLDVLNGSVEGTSERAGSLPDLEHVGVPVKPATPDVTPQVTEVLGFDPDAIVYSAQGADCWNFVDGLGRLGWTPDAIPLVLSTACLDFDAMRAAGPLAEGVYFVGSNSAVTSDPATVENPRDAFEAELYQTKAVEYGMPETDVFKGFGTQGFTGLVNLWGIASDVVVAGEELTPETFTAALAATEGSHAFGSTPLSCATAPDPYIAVCNAVVRASQWDGETLQPVRSGFTGIDLLAGTELKPGPD